MMKPWTGYIAIALLSTVMLSATGKTSTQRSNKGRALPAVQSQTVVIEDIHKKLSALQKKTPKLREVNSVGDFGWDIYRYSSDDGLQLTIVTTACMGRWEDYICLSKKKKIIYFSRVKRYWTVQLEDDTKPLEDIHKISQTIAQEYFFSEDKKLLFYCMNDPEGPGNEYSVKIVRKIAHYIDNISMTGKEPDLDGFSNSIYDLSKKPDSSD